jgi:hypothetical protein
VESSASQNKEIKAESNTLLESTPVKAKQQQPLIVDKEDIYLAFVPQEGQDVTESPLEVYLINDSNYILLYSFNEEVDGKYEGVTAGHVDPRSKIIIREYTNKDLGQLSSYLFQFVFYQKGKYELKTPLEKTLKIYPVKFYKSNSFQESQYFKQRVILHRLTGTDLEKEVEEISTKEMKKILREKEQSSKKAIKTPQELKAKDEIIEVDLHINALLDTVTGLSNADILEYQLNEFHQVMRQYQNKKGQRIVFIHGIGNGTLKKKVHDELRRKYKKHYQQDASFKEYGWGATMVTIR